MPIGQVLLTEQANGHLLPGPCAGLIPIRPWARKVISAAAWSANSGLPYCLNGTRPCGVVTSCVYVVVTNTDGIQTLLPAVAGDFESWRDIILHLLSTGISGMKHYGQGHLPMPTGIRLSLTGVSWQWAILSVNTLPLRQDISFPTGNEKP